MSSTDCLQGFKLRITEAEEKEALSVPGSGLARKFAWDSLKYKRKKTSIMSDMVDFYGFLFEPMNLGSPSAQQWCHSSDILSYQ